MTAYDRVSIAISLALALVIGPVLFADCEQGTPPPSVSISYVPLNQMTGDGKLSIPYSFPNMTNQSKRQLTYFIDGIQGLTIAAPLQSGVWEPDVDMTCRSTGTHSLRADAISLCTPQLKSSGFNSVTANTTPNVSISYAHDAQGHGTISVPYEFPNTSAPGQRQLTLFIDGVQNITIGAPDNTGTWNSPWDITCWSGAHEFEVVAHACGNSSAAYSDTDATTVNADPKPSVSLSFSAQNGGVASIPYEFPLTATPQQRSVALYRDGAFFGFAPSPLQNGTWSPTVGSCWKELRAVATACGGGSEYTTEKNFKNPLDQLKPITVSLLKTGANGNTSIIQATVTWNNATPGSTVSVNFKNWVDGKGQSYGGDLLKAFDNVPVSKTETFTFNAPSGARQLSVVATVQTPCGIAKDDASIACDACDATGNPVYWSDGNMRLTDGEPLPPIAGHALVRTYDSEERVGGIFGRGWTSMFERRLIGHTDGSVSIVTGTNEVVTFRLVSGVYRQTWPQSVRARGTLVHDSGAGTYTYRAPGSAEVAIFRASDGRLITLRDTASAREAVLAYDAQGRPAAFTDSVTEVTWSLALDAQRRVTSISVAGHPELEWAYTYDAANNLLTVLAPGAAPWRTYEYLDDRMTASRDALGHLIESHTYDAEGHATSSTGDIDEIESIDYGLPGSTAEDRVTRITYKTGAVSEYTLRPIGSAWRPVQVAGGCASCGSRDATYARDGWGRVIRQQGGDGYITATTYANDVVASVQESLQPVGCDPQTDPQRCRLDPDVLATVTLESTSSSVTTTYEYADPLWPDRPTKILRPSVVSPAYVREENRLYHAVTGVLTRHEHRGRQGDILLSRVTTWTFYEDTGTAPAFDPGGLFQSSWLSLPQPLDLVKTVDGPRTDVQDITSYVYYPIDSSVPALLRSRLAAVKNAAGHITRYESYDVFGNATRVVDPNGVATEMTFDALGRPLTTTTKAVPGCNPALDPLCSVDVTTTRVYTPASGPLVRVTSPRGGVTVYAYDDRGRLHTLARGSGVNDLSERIETTYDPLTGKKSHESRQAFVDGEWAEQWSQSFVYDSRARLQSIVHPDGAAVHYTYDAEDRIATVRDENHAAPNTTYAYDPAGRVSRVTQTLATQQGGTITTQYSYHLDSSLASVTDPNGNVTTYFYNDLGDLREQTSPVTGETGYGYDKAGNLTDTGDANGMQTTRQYDALNRVTSATSEGAGMSETVTWSYDDPATGRFGIGRLTSSTDPSGDVSYSYERRGLLRQETRHVSPVVQTHTTSYVYDADGNRSGITYPSGRHVAYGFDYAGRPTNATGAVVDASYLPFGPMATLTFANGTRQFMSYDARYRMTDNALMTSVAPPAKPLLLARYTYDHDDVGNITSIADYQDATYNRTFQYDDLNRLIVANTGSSLWQTGSYSWDAMGNLKTMSLGTAAGRSSTFAYEGSTPKLASVTTNGVTNEVAYDAAGNEISYLATRSYSPRNLTEEIVPGSDRVMLRNTYDGRGIRVVGETTAGPVATSRTYLYTPEMQLMAVTVPDDATIDYEIVWFAGRPVAQISSTGTRYTFADHLGTPILQAGDSSTIIWRAEYEPFGNIFLMRTGASTDQPLRFPGQEVAFSWEGQEENYNIHRWYRSGWGRYTQADPIGLAPDTNLLRYAAARPVVTADPLGLFCTKDFVLHYLGGSGTTINLKAVGLLSTFISSPSVSGAIDSELKANVTIAKQNAIQACAGCPNGNLSGTFKSGGDDVFVNVFEDNTPCVGWPIGSTILSVWSDCKWTANCTAKTFKVACKSDWKLRDRFTNPLSQGEPSGNPGKPNDLFGVPYDIVADWSVNSFGGGSW